MIIPVEVEIELENGEKISTLGMEKKDGTE